MEIIFLKLIVNSNKQPNGCFFYKLKDIIREDTKEEIEMIISTLSSYPNKKVVKDLGIVVGYSSNNGSGRIYCQSSRKFS